MRRTGNERLLVSSGLIIGVGLALSSSGVWAQRPAGQAATDIASSARRAPDGKETVALLSRLVTIEFHATPIREALDRAAAQARVHLVYRPEELGGGSRTVTFGVRQVKLGDVFDRIIDGLNVQVVGLPGGLLTIIPIGDSTPAAPRSVGTLGGRIVDSATGRGLSGATVKIAGSKLSGIAGDSGQFVIRDVPAGHQFLTAKLFGYHPLEQDVVVLADQRVTVRMRMTAAPNLLSGVVTTATGVQRRVEIGSDVTSINADSVMRTAPIASMTDLLETRVPGLQVVHTSGTPGAPSRIRLRGVSSINENNDPIVIVDGIRVFSAQSDSVFGSTSLAQSSSDGARNHYGKPSPLDQIDPNSVERVDVFKGPAATAIYGSDAANGVIVVTTKRGRAGETHWNLAAKQGLTYMPGDYPNVVRGWGHITPTSPLNIGGVTICSASGDPFSSATGSFNGGFCTQDSVNRFQALNVPRLTVFGRGTRSDASASVTGGTSSLTYGFTGSGTTEIGLLKLPDVESDRYKKYQGVDAPGWMHRPDKYTTWSGTGNIQAQLNSVTRLSVTTSLFNGNQQQSSLDDAIRQLANVYVDTTTLDSIPLVKKFYERATSTGMTMNASGQLTWGGIRWLPLDLTGGISTVNSTDKTMIPRGLVAESTQPDSAGFFSIGRGTTIDRTANLAAQRFPLTRFVTGNLGFNLHTSSSAALSSRIFRIPAGATEPSTFDCPASLQGGGVVSADLCGTSVQQSVASTTFGWFFVPTLNFNSRFFVSPGFRFDGGSSSGSNTGLTAFPKIDLSWIALDRQEQAPLFGVLSMFRPRIAIGIAGVQPGPTDRLRLVRDSVRSLDGGVTVVDQVVVRTLGNTQLRPERSNSVEGGVDADLWKNRLSLTITGYRQIRHDAIVAIPIASSVNGGGMVSQNIGLIRNTGVEWMADANLVQTSTFGWHAGITGSTNHNRVLRTNAEQSTIDVTGTVLGGGARTLIRPGYPLNGQWTNPVLGYRDANGNGRIEKDEVLVGDSLLYIGQQDPDYQFAFNTDVTVGPFSLRATADYKNGLGQINAANQGLSTALFDPMSSLADQALAVAQFIGAQSLQDVVGDRIIRTSVVGQVQTVSTMRLQWLSLGYNAPVSVAQWFRSKRMTIALQGSNLWLHTNYRGKDPDVNSNTTGNTTVDAGALPRPRTWSIGITLGN